MAIHVALDVLSTVCAGSRPRMSVALLSHLTLHPCHALNYRHWPLARVRLLTPPCPPCRSLWCRESHCTGPVNPELRREHSYRPGPAVSQDTMTSNHQRLRPLSHRGWLAGGGEGGPVHQYGGFLHVVSLSGTTLVN